jgi:hypothetical protein
MYRTKTYIAADWTGDKDIIEQLYKWNNSNYLLLSFVDAHEFTQSRDTSLPCSIKDSLRERLNISKTFVLIVGEQTKVLRKGSCKYCNSYSSFSNRCMRYQNLDFRSFIEYECEMAIKDFQNGDLSKIVVIYNYANVNKEKCPDCIKNFGKHINAYYYDEERPYWNYTAIKNEICD